MKKYTQQEVLDLVINTYNSNNRATAYGGCRYRVQKEGESEPRKCAVGLLIDDKDYKPDWDDTVEAVSDIFDELPDYVKILGKDFLVAIQHLHDTEKFWNEEGLSEKGIWHVETIKEKFNLK